MPTDLLAELKKLQYKRSESSPFSSNVEFDEWADRALPLLSFDPKLQTRFRNMVLATNSSRHFKIEKQEIGNINSAIGIVNQAITSLEVMPIPHSAGNPATNPSNSVKPPAHSLTIQIGVGVFIVFVGLLVGYLLKTHFGISQ